MKEGKLKTYALTRRFGVATLSPESVSADGTPVFHVKARICGPCLLGTGSECHTPGCLLYLHNSPGYPLNLELVEDATEE